MKAAIVSTFGVAPHYGEFADPTPADGEIVVDVLAAGLHPRVRSQADGSHYTSTGELPLVPGVDGVGRDGDGVVRYFVLPDTTLGSMAERTVIDPRRSVALPTGADPIVVAAGMNPAMSSWVALRRRIAFEPGQSVLVLGATGNAGRLAVGVARRLGAARVVAAGRHPERIADLPAEVVDLDDVAVAAEVDVVLDYLWGEPAAAAMVALVTGRSDRGRPLRWVQIGSVAGATAPVPSAALRASGLQLVGSGQGSVRTRDIVAELGELAAELPTLGVAAQGVPLCDVERVWTEPADRRVVLVP